MARITQISLSIRAPARSTAFRNREMDRSCDLKAADLIHQTTNDTTEKLSYSSHLGNSWLKFSVSKPQGVQDH